MHFKQHVKTALGEILGFVELLYFARAASCVVDIYKVAFDQALNQTVLVGGQNQSIQWISTPSRLAKTVINAIQ